MSSVNDKGKWAESEVRKWMEAQSARDANFTYHRYPDSKAARGALAAQPSDYLVGARGQHFHIEVKETEQVRRLPKAKIRQYGMLLKWWWAKITPYVVIYRSGSDDWCALGPTELFEFEDCPPSFLISDRPKYTSAGSLLESLLT